MVTLRSMKLTLLKKKYYSRTVYVYHVLHKLSHFYGFSSAHSNINSIDHL